MLKKNNRIYGSKKNGKSDKPLLGICLGMQLLATEGKEGAENGKVIKGLNLIPGKVELLSVKRN